MNPTPTAVEGAVVRLRAGADVITAIERFSLDGSERPASPAGQPEDRSTRTRVPADPQNPTLGLVGTTRAAGYLRGTLRSAPGFVAGILLAGHDGELVLYSQWEPDRGAPEQIPDDWSLAPALDGAVRVDARTYTVDFTAPDVVSEASAATPHAHFGVFTVDPDDQQAMLDLARDHAPDSIGTPGLRAITFHRSTDGRRVINLGLWSGFDEFTALLSRPGFTGGGEYWGDVAGFRPHYFDVAALATA